MDSIYFIVSPRNSPSRRNAFISTQPGVERRRLRRQSYAVLRRGPDLPPQRAQQRVQLLLSLAAGNTVIKC
jgi:hypothetical protein